MSLTWVVLPVIGGLIGWITNLIAIRMLFRPRKPVRILGIHFQGVLPRRQAKLASAIAQTVEKDLLPMEELLEAVDLAGHGERIVQDIIAHVDKRIQTQIPDIVPPAMKQLVASFARTLIAREAPRLIEELIENVSERLQSELDVEELVRTKIESFDVSQLEDVALKIARTELRVVELLGGVLGAVIGLIQAVIVSILN